MLPGLAAAQGLVTEPSAHPLRETLDRLEAAVRAEGWMVFAEIDHAAAARTAGLALDPRIVVLFGNSRSGTGAMAAHPTLALDLPMRALVWADAEGHVFVTRSTGADIAVRVFARHGMDMPEAGQQATEALLARLVRQATR